MFAIKYLCDHEDHPEHYVRNGAAKAQISLLLALGKIPENEKRDDYETRAHFDTRENAEAACDRINEDDETRKAFVVYDPPAYHWTNILQERPQDGDKVLISDGKKDIFQAKFIVEDNVEKWQFGADSTLKGREKLARLDVTELPFWCKYILPVDMDTFKRGDIRPVPTNMH